MVHLLNEYLAATFADRAFVVLETAKLVTILSVCLSVTSDRSRNARNGRGGVGGAPIYCLANFSIMNGEDDNISKFYK